eukprot:9732531-Lingulodinium_polyedra.AAC.1
MQCVHIAPFGSCFARRALPGCPNKLRKDMMALWVDVRKTLDLVHLPKIFAAKANDVSVCRLAGVCLCGPGNAPLRACARH